MAMIDLESLSGSYTVCVPEPAMIDNERTKQNDITILYRCD